VQGGTGFPAWVKNPGRASLSGTQYIRWINIGMPKIPIKIINSAFYLYANVEDAQKGVRAGATGFFVGVPSAHPGYVYGYGITNWHVALRDGFSVIRINKNDGEPDIIPFEPTDWEFIVGGGDIAVSPPVSLNDSHAVSITHIDHFATDDIIKKYEINVGDDVFMIGRFIDHDGGHINTLSARFGNISVMPVPIPQEANRGQGNSYILDMHSRPGYSGSPVFVYRIPGGDLDEAHGKRRRFSQISLVLLLGIHWGQFPEIWQDSMGNKIKGFSGMTCVTPSQRILELLNIEKLTQHRLANDEALKKVFNKSGWPPESDSLLTEPKPTISDNPQHKENFTSLGSTAAKKKLQDGET
jgi:hypothetical protein